MRICRIEELPGDHDVYDLTVEFDHSFIVADCVLHNSGTCRSLDQTVVSWNGKITMPDGKTMQKNYRPKPPFHVGCRTTTTAELDARYKLGDSRSTRASKGDEGGKQVGAKSTYYGWLKQQSAAFQDATVGTTRGKLLRNGGLTSQEFARLNVNDKFQALTLEEMRAKDPEAFESAGL